jgi:hypothetical protein
MVEIEIGVLRGQCLGRRIGERKQLVSQIAAWENQRNAAKARIKWMFTVDRARTKLARAYPDPAKESCSPFQVAGTENLCLFVQAVQHGRR